MVGTHKISSKENPAKAYKNRASKTYGTKSKITKRVNRNSRPTAEMGVNLAQVIWPNQLIKEELTEDIKPIDGFLRKEHKVSSLVKVENYEYEIDNLSSEDWKSGREICRCCLVDSDMYCDLTVAEEDISYADMLQDCFGIQICAESYRSICDVCATRLRDACLFKRQVLTCQARLLNAPPSLPSPGSPAAPHTTKDVHLTEDNADTKYDSQATEEKVPNTSKSELPKKCAQRKTYKDDFKKISPTEYRCNICNETVSSMPAMKSHRRQYHRFACHCGERFKSQQMLIRHKLDKHQQDDSYKCNACDKSFFNRNGFRVHLKRYHMLGEKICCDKCDYECYTGRRMRDHQLVHAPSRDFRCKFCKKTFMRPSNLRQHEMIHTGVKNKVCAQCGQGFVQKASLNYHMAKHHPNVKF